MIVITTPTGKIGLADLADLADGQAVRVVARDASRLDPGVRDEVEVVEGSHRDSTVLGRALRDADALLLVVPPDPTSEDVDATYRTYGQAAAAAITGSGVPRVVVVSSAWR